MGLTTCLSLPVKMSKIKILPLMINECDGRRNCGRRITMVYQIFNVLRLMFTIKHCTWQRSFVFTYNYLYYPMFYGEDWERFYCGLDF